MLLGVLGVQELFSGLLSSLIIPGAFVVGAILGALRRQVALIIVDAALLLVYVVVAYTPLMARVTPAFVRNEPAAHTDAVVALSSGVLETGALDGPGTERLLTAVAYAADGWAPRLITTRLSTEVAGRATTSDGAQRALLTITRSPADWVVVDSVGSTRDEAVRVARALLSTGARRVAVVTNPIHTRRACAAFEHEGLLVTCIAATEHIVNAGRPQTPPERLEAFRQCLYESLATAKYRAKRWIS